MLNLKRLPTGVALLNWNSELPSSGTGDPLGMTLRVGARLGAELLHCITSITPRARYYSFFPWAFQRAQDRTRGKGDFDQLMRFVLIDERAMTLGAVLHHNGNPCEGGSLQGSNRAVDLAANSSKRSIDLGQWSHLRDNASGFAAYKGSLINLGIFAESASPDTADDEDENGQSNNLTSGELSAKGRKLATAFGQAVAGTEFVKMGPEGRSMDLDVLEEFGASAGLCELRAAEEFDLLPLRDLFFSTDSDSQLNSHYRRRMSLLLLLWHATRRIAPCPGHLLQPIDHHFTTKPAVLPVNDPPAVGPGHKYLESNSFTRPLGNASVSPDRRIVRVNGSNVRNNWLQSAVRLSPQSRLNAVVDFRDRPVL